MGRGLSCLSLAPSKKRVLFSPPHFQHREPRAQRREKSSERLSYIFLSAPANHFMYIYVCWCTYLWRCCAHGMRERGFLFKSHSTDNNEAMKTSAYLNENLGTKFITLGPGTFLYFSSLLSFVDNTVERCSDQSINSQEWLIFKQGVKRGPINYINFATHDVVSER